MTISGEYLGDHLNHGQFIIHKENLSHGDKLMDYRGRRQAGFYGKCPVCGQLSVVSCPLWKAVGTGLIYQVTADLGN
jgi:hypothetical protein